MNKDQLIEKARVAYVEAWEAENARIENWDRDSRGKHTRSRAGIEAAFAVFEEAHAPVAKCGGAQTNCRHDMHPPMHSAACPVSQAHTPTDDERERLLADAAAFTDGYTEESASGTIKVIIRLADALRRTVQGEPTDPNQIPDAVADAAQIAFHEFAWGDEPIGRLSVSRQGWKVAIAAALDEMKGRD